MTKSQIEFEDLGRLALGQFLTERAKFPLAVDATNEALDRALTFLNSSKAKIIYPGHPDFPFDAQWAGEVPPFLTYWGEPVWKNKRCLSIVGSREPNRSSIEWMDVHLNEFLERTDCAIVSGGARGCDQKAHWTAMRAKKPTVVFLPSGLAKPYPTDWSEWRDQVVNGGGAVVSHYPPYQEIRREHFAERNRWIALMGRLLFVVEARRKSGSLMTARLAREADRTLCVLPGRPMDPTCAGTNDLLFEGAFPIRDARDLETLFSASMPGPMSF